MESVYLQKSLVFVKIFFDGHFWCYASKSLWRSEKEYNLVEDSIETKRDAIQKAKKFLAEVTTCK